MSGIDVVFLKKAFFLMNQNLLVEILLPVKFFKIKIVVMKTQVKRGRMLMLKLVAALLNPNHFLMAYLN